MKTSPTELVHSSVVEQLNDALSAINAAGEGVCMLAVVASGNVQGESVARLMQADSSLRDILRELAPEADAPTTDWGRLLIHFPQITEKKPSEMTASPHEIVKPSLRDITLEAARACPDVYFTPQHMFAVLEQDSTVDRSVYPDFRKAIQNCLAALARSGKLTKAARGQYITPGRESDAVEEGADHEPRRLAPQENVAHPPEATTQPDAQEENANGRLFRQYVRNEVDSRH